MAIKINLLPFICEALGHAKKIHKDIDRLYQIKKYEFYRLARESEVYNHMILKEADLRREEYAKKALGIILYAYHNQDDTSILDKLDALIRKGWTRAYMWVETHENFSLGEYIHGGIKSGNYKTDDDLNTDLLIVIWLAAISGKTIEQDEFLKTAEEYFLNRLKYAKKNSEIRYSHRNLKPDELKNIRALKQRIYSTYGKLNSYDGIFHSNKDLLKIAEPMSLIIDTENISISSIFNNIKFNEKDIEEILGTYYGYYKNKNAEKAVKHLIWGLIIKGFCKAYKQVKQYYFENNKETVFIELENQEAEVNKLREENEILKKKVENLENKAQSIKKSAEEKYLHRIRELENEVGKLKTQLIEEKEKDRELAALREFMFSLDQGLVPENTAEVPDLSGTTGAIIGGHHRWQEKMKELLPGWVFISSEKFDPKVLDGVDVICFFTQHLGHPLYYKAIDEARKRGLKVGYINNVNEELVLKEVANITKNLAGDPSF